MTFLDNPDDVLLFAVKTIVRMLRYECGLTDKQKAILQELLIQIQNNLKRTSDNLEITNNIIKLADCLTPGIMTRRSSKLLSKLPLEIRICINEFNADEQHSLLQMRNYTDWQPKAHFYSWLNSCGSYYIDRRGGPPYVGLNAEEINNIHHDLIAPEPKLRRFHAEAHSSLFRYLKTLSPILKTQALARLLHLEGGTYARLDLRHRDLRALAARPELFSIDVGLNSSAYRHIPDLMRRMRECPEKENLLLSYIGSRFKAYPMTLKDIPSDVGTEDQIARAIENSSREITLPDTKSSNRIIAKMNLTLKYVVTMSGSMSGWKKILPIAHLPASGAHKVTV